ncbi:MAG: Na/Pi cotransporter family protein [Woeseiaceae bacterium]|nr:Na/Pi cotransporter family protein [Woeseiaceae bacterium]
MSDLHWGVIITQMGGGLALFLYGMRQMTESLKTVAGDGMKRLLARLTTNRFTAALAGAVVTAVIQSSSVTTVLVVGFISAGLLQFAQSVGVILGANVGTTVTAQIIAFQVYKYGLLLIAAGFFTEILARRERVRQWGTAAMGLGLIFFGMELMSIATGPFREWPPFINLMQNISNPAITVAIGAVFTAIVQSSSATTGIVIVLASQGLISLETGIGIILGANIGTCVTAFASALGRPREALQAAWAHLVFNFAGVLLWVFFIGPFADIVRTLSPVTPGLTGLELAAADTPRQIANAHTLFNFANLFLFIWFTGPLARLIQRIVPIPPAPEGVRPKYLDDYFLTQPSLALDLVRKELTHLGELTRTMIDRALATTIQGSEQDAAAMSKADDDVDVVYGDIIRYLGRLSQQDLIAPQPKQLHDYVGIANYLENVGDVIDKDLLAVAAKRRRQSLVIGPKTREKLQELADEVGRAFGLALEAIETGGPDIALEVLESKSTVFALAEDASVHIAKRLVAEEPHRLETFQIETDIIELYRRLNTLSRRIARLSIDASIAGAHPEETEGE